ncbi:MAG: alpha/beta fold hydrolase [Acidobacteria bacterium]|nr:MAG: alpha/beta fold hydrolase [Acidobacteriota bacterium]RPJ76986.1 MAG: alpha/beta fold hydrolase [Acidobacteriota bacterium]
MFRRHPAVAAALAAALLSLVTPAVSAAQAPSGAWAGAIAIMGQKLDIVVTFSGEGSGLKATIDIPQQGATGLPLLNLKAEGTKVHFELQAGPGLAVFDGERKGDTIAGTFEQSGMKGAFDLAPKTAAQAEPPPPYAVEDVKIPAGTVTLAGTLTLPPGTGPHPVVVLITGSGAQNRDEEIFGMKPFRLIADHLTRLGVAVLRCDDRGVGGSTGSMATATTADFADDTAAMVQFLKARADIDKARIGLLGHSEGGLVAPLVASRSKDVAFVVLMSAPAVTGEQILLEQGLLLARASGLPADQIARNAELQRKVFAAVRTGQGWQEVEEQTFAATRESLEKMPEAQRKAIPDLDGLAKKTAQQQLAAARSPWFKYFLEYDPAPALSKVTCPVLAIFGEKDLQVPVAQNRDPMEAIFRKSGNRRVAFQVVPRANHLYQDSITGNATEYATLKKEFVPGFLDLVGKWVKEQVQVKGTQ